jgi:hypothetical protein
MPVVVVVARGGGEVVVRWWLRVVMARCGGWEVVRWSWSHMVACRVVARWSLWLWSRTGGGASCSGHAQWCIGWW